MTAAPTFVRDIADIDPGDARRYGGKATGLARMAAAGLPIPPAFVVDTEGYRAFRDNGGRLPDALLAQVHDALARLEKSSGKTFAGGDTPLLVSVRSGAAISMPGMMDTVLNLGLDTPVAMRLATLMGNPGFAVDTWTRFWRMYADTVLGLDPLKLAEQVETPAQAARNGGGEAAFKAFEDAVVATIREEGEEVEPSPHHHLERTIAAVFESWDSRRARAYRKHHAIPDDLGTAVTIQAMVFGNLDERSGSGVAFTRNPNTGEPALYGEYLTGRQGEDLVAGTHTPIDLTDPQGMPGDLRNALLEAGNKLEQLYQDAVDIEFTVEAGKLYLLQVRAAKRTAAAAVRIAVDAVDEGLIEPRDAVARVTAEQVRKLLRPTFDEAALAQAQVLAQGLGSSPGQVHGAAILDADRAAQRAGEGEAVILVRPTTSPLDIRGMLAAAGIVTAAGGALSHAAVVSRALDKPCVAGCKTLKVEPERGRFLVDGTEYPEGTEISIDGTSGKLYAGAIPTQTAGAQASSLERLLGWADAFSSAAIWPAPRKVSEIAEGVRLAPQGIGVVGLTDLLIAGDDVDRFIELLGPVGQDEVDAACESEIAEIVERACRPAVEAADGIALHIRLPRVSSERARQLIENRGELPPRLFLPLGAPAYLRAILTGLSAAAGDKGGSETAVLIGNITDAQEFARFREAVVASGRLSAGAVVQNVVALGVAAEMAEHGPVWLDIPEIIRSAYGFPIEVIDAGTALPAYTSDGNLSADPSAGLGALLADLMQPLGQWRDDRVRIAGVGCTPQMLADLYGRGFRTFGVPPGTRDELRLLFGQAATRSST